MDSLEDLDDHELMYRSALGESRAFETLWKRHYWWLHAYAQRYCATSDESEDLVQEVFVRVLRAARDYDKRASFRSWAKRIAGNLGIDHSRARAARPLSAGFIPESWAEEADDRYLPESALDTEWLREELRQAIDQLSEKQKTVVAMRYFGAMSIADIAWATGIPVGTVKSRLHNGLKRIKAFLAHKNNETEEH
jgi:RNA polymerase sigma-70 factor, ECF subfamily